MNYNSESKYKVPQITIESATGNYSITGSTNQSHVIEAGNVVYGSPGKSAYQVWLDNGNTGAETEFLAAIGSADVAQFNQRLDDLETDTDLIDGGYIF